MVLLVLVRQVAVGQVALLALAEKVELMVAVAVVKAMALLAQYALFGLALQE